MDVNGRKAMNKNETQTNESRRDFIKKAAYTAPAIVTLSALPTMHAVGSTVNNDGTTGGGTTGGDPNGGTSG
jgi:hypothetical protein